MMYSLTVPSSFLEMLNGWVQELSCFKFPLLYLLSNDFWPYQLFCIMYFPNWWNTDIMMLKRTVIMHLYIPTIIFSLVTSFNNNTNLFIILSILTNFSIVCWLLKDNNNHALYHHFYPAFDINNTNIFVGTLKLAHFCIWIRAQKSPLKTTMQWGHTGTGSEKAGCVPSSLGTLYVALLSSAPESMGVSYDHSWWSVTVAARLLIMYLLPVILALIVCCFYKKTNYCNRHSIVCGHRHQTLPHFYPCNGGQFIPNQLDRLQYFSSFCLPVCQQRIAFVSLQ